MPSVLDFDSPEQPIQPTGSAVKPFINITPKSNLGVMPGAVMPTAPNMPPQDMRSFVDIDKTRNAIYDNVLRATQEMPEFSNNRYKMRLVNAQYVDNDKPTIAERKKAILRQESLERRLQGTWQLLDLDDNIVDEKKVTMARIPKLTNGGTFVLNGVEYTLANQARLRPGVFTREKANGEIESHVNVMPGKGVSHRYTLDPEKGVFKMTLGQASIPLFPLLRMLGAKDDQIRKAWGNELYEVNAKNNDPQAVDKLIHKMLRKSDQQLDAESKSGKLRELFNKMELDDVVTNRTLGKPYKNLSIDAMLDSTRKILAVQKREAEPDDRDAMAYQMIYGPEDFFSERIRSAYKVMNPILWKATFKNNLSSLSSGFLDKHVKAAIISSGLGQPSEEVNNAEILGQLTRMSRLGEGGIPSLDAVPEEARSVQPSHFGFVDPLLTPESLKVGVDSRLAMSTMKGTNGKVYTKFLNVKTGEPEWKSPQDVADSVIAFPKELDDPNNDTVAALVSGKIKYVPREQVEFTLPHMEDSFNPLVNMIPLKSATKGQRVMMGARMTTQALPLRDAESPYVQAGVPGDVDESFEERYGSYMGAIKSNAEGQVVEVTPDGIKVKDTEGKIVEHELHNNVPYNRKTYIHNTPTVKVGDMVGKDTLLAKSNFTDGKGSTALGLNLRTAYIPYKGANFEDAIVISQSAAKRLSSEHLYQHDTEFEEGLKHGKKNYIAMFPSSYDRKILENLDDDGVVKPGTVVHKDMPLILQIKEKERTHNQIGRSRGQLFNDASVTWDHHDSGVVTDVEKTKKGMLVTVKSYSEMKVADKLSGRYGDKGVIADIISDDKMPKDAEGRPFEVLVNPLGIISRTNPSQMVEAALGKIVEKTGKRYAVKDFSDIKDMVQFAKDELKKHNLKDLEDIEDPDTSRKIKNVFTGNRFFMKLHHMAESKGSGRGLGSYTNEDTPAKGGPQGSKRVSLADTNALLSHGALEVITDAKSIRGQKNQDYWASFMAGKTPPPPKVPLVYNKFFNQLRSAGINPVRNGPRIQIMALTNKDIDELAKGREIESAETVDWKEGLKPIKGGLFDPSLTGGHNGNQWSYIKLHEPMPNPVMEEPIRRVLGLTKHKFMDVLAGKEVINGQTGPQAIKSALGNIDLEKATREAEHEWRNGRKSTKDAALKRWSVLKHSGKLGINPADWMMDKIPVLPPAFRPVSVMGATGKPLVADANYLYKEAFEANQALKETAGFSNNLGDERTSLYKSFKAVTGLGDPVSPKNQERQVKGVLKYIFGDNPKFSTMQRKLLSTTVDVVGRGVITPNPDLDMDQVGLPESKAWEIYRPFIVRRLARRGVPPIRAAELVEQKDKAAKDALLEEMDERPVIITRAPVLHRYGVMAFKPQLTKAETLQIPPAIVTGFGADFDGDTMNYHVPVSDGAVKDALEKMLPSKNLMSTKNFKAHQLPKNEYQGGLYHATAFVSNKPERYFATKADAIKAYKNGEIESDQKVVILN
jgi:DNA-directed RNA polymerase subunit beta